MFRKRLPPAAVSSEPKQPASSRWRINGVPLNVRTTLLAAALVAAIVFVADLSYRMFADGPTDMTLPAPPFAAGSGEQAAAPEVPSR